MADKLVGSINLKELSNVGVMTVQGKTTSKKCVVIPIDDNDIYVKDGVNEQGKTVVTKLNLGIEIYERKDVGEFGHTHYAKCALSGEFVNTHSKEVVDEKNSHYLGDFKPIAIKGGNAAATVEAPMYVAPEDSDLPF